jgi:hypothetical protein
MEVLALPVNSPSTITSGGQDSAAAARNAHVICAESAKRLSLSPLSHRVGTAGAISACDSQVVTFDAGLFCRSKGLVCQSRAETQSSRPTSESVTPSPASASTASSPSSRGPHQRLESADVVCGSLEGQSASWDGEIVATPNLNVPASHIPTDVHSLDDNPGTTLQSMDLASEQDPHFIDAFRSVLVSERDGIDAGILQVFPSGSDPERYPAQFLLLHDKFPAQRNAAKHASAEAIENIVWPHGPAMIRLYFRYVHPTLLIISKCRFLRQYAIDKDAVSASLRGAVYALACVF